MAYISIQPKDNFNVIFYTGTGAAQSITGVGFRPDLIWIKRYDGTAEHKLFDINRNNFFLKKALEINTTALIPDTTLMQSLDADGFSLAGTVNGNTNTENYLAYCWKGGGSVARDNYDGSGNPDGDAEDSTVSLNAAAGISIIEYTGTGGGGNSWRTHGLGTYPHWQLYKCIQGRTEDWFDWQHKVVSSKYASNLSNTNVATTFGIAWNSTDPTSDLFVTGYAQQTNEATNYYVNYVFTSIKGFSKMSDFTGNGNADGPFVYTGFRPAWVVVKNTENASTNHYMWDRKRLGYNVDNNALYPNTTAAQQTDDEVDFLSNGFKIRNSWTGINGSGNQIIYSAFAEFPLVSTNKISGVAR